MIETYENWLSQVAAPDDVECRAHEFFVCYGEKMALAKRFAPTAQLVAEIGVRAGYSAHAFLSAVHPKAYMGYDLFKEYYRWKGGSEHAEMILKRDFPEAQVTLVRADTQQMSSIGLHDVGLFHVDGGHFHDQCFHDMKIAWTTLCSGGVMLVDDYDWVTEVKSAVDRFIYFKEDEIEHHEYIKTFRGDMVLVKR